MAGALLAGLAHRSFLSLTALFVAGRLRPRRGRPRGLDFDPTSGFVHGLAIVALIVILFRDGLEVEAEMLQPAWRLPLRKLLLAMPLTALIVALAARALTDLGWTECFLLGALLSPTDPVLSSAVVTNPRVPRVVATRSTSSRGSTTGWRCRRCWRCVAALAPDGDSRGGSSCSRTCSSASPPASWSRCVAARLMPRARGLEEGPTDAQRSLYALGTAFTAYGVAVVRAAGGQRPDRGVRVRDRARHPAARPARRRSSCIAADIVEIVKLGVFVVFGSLLTLDGLFADGWAAVGAGGRDAVGGPARGDLGGAGRHAARRRRRRRSWPGSAPRAWRR